MSGPAPSPAADFDPKYWVAGTRVRTPRFLHAMIRVSSFDAALRFYVTGLGMQVVERFELEAKRVSSLFIGFGDHPEGGLIELIHSWDADTAGAIGTGSGHVAIGVPDVPAVVARVEALGAEVTVRPTPYFAGGPLIAFVKDLDGHAVELVQSWKE